MTEDEAKARWCPMVRHGDSGGGSFNRGSEADNPLNTGRPDGGWPCRCIGSACMMWRWDKVPESNMSLAPVEGWDHYPANSIWPERWIEPHKEAVMRRRGFCGLAGRPEIN